VLRRKLAVLVAATLMAMMAVAGPAFAQQGPGQQASCVGQEASTFAREFNLGEFISSGAGPEFGPFVSERAQEDRSCPPA
jgi:hypothetical protein